MLEKGAKSHLWIFFLRAGWTKWHRLSWPCLVAEEGTKWWLQVCPWCLWSHDCPKSPLCTYWCINVKWPHWVWSYYSRFVKPGQKVVPPLHCELNSPSTRCSAMVTEDRLSWVEVFGGRPMLDREGVPCWTGRASGEFQWTLWHPKSKTPLPHCLRGLRAMHGAAPSLSSPRGCPRSTAWSQAEQTNTEAAFSLLTLPRYQTCWQQVSRQKMERRKKKWKKKCYYQDRLLENAKAGADGLTFEDEKSQAAAFPHSSQSPTNTAILGAAQTFASQVRGEGEGKRKRSSGKTCPVNLALSYKTSKAQGDECPLAPIWHFHCSSKIREIFPSVTLPQVGRHQLQSISQS